MCLNEKRRLTIPPGKAYGVFLFQIPPSKGIAYLLKGSRGFGSVIPPNSALVFEVELVNLKKTDRDEL
jgi:FKBP-type peptidyl-prolyl cis-trans isomerase